METTQPMKGIQPKMPPTMPPDKTHHQRQHEGVKPYSKFLPVTIFSGRLRPPKGHSRARTEA